MKTRRGDVVLVLFPNLSRAGHPSRFRISIASAEGRSSGLRLDSVIMTDNLATVLDSEIDSILGRLPDMTTINAALRYTFALDE